MFSNETKVLKKEKCMKNFVCLSVFMMSMLGCATQKPVKAPVCERPMTATAACADFIDVTCEKVAVCTPDFDKVACMRRGMDLCAQVEFDEKFRKDLYETGCLSDVTKLTCEQVNGEVFPESCDGVFSGE